MTEMWTRPLAEVQQFAANEYVAACGKRDGKYIFTCDAPAGTVHITYNGKDYRLGDYGPCGEKHETDGPGGYYDGWVDHDYDGRQGTNEPDILIWVEGLKYHPAFILIPSYITADNWHASASLTREQIQVERS